MRQWLGLAATVALTVTAAQLPMRAAAQTVTPSAQAPIPAAAQTVTPAVQAPIPAAAQARSDSLARAALAATVAGERLFVDVRTPQEFQAGHLPGAINIPLAELEQRWPELKAYPRRQIVLYCRSGHRAGLALESVKQHGIGNAVNGGGLESLRALLPAAPSSR